MSKKVSDKMFVIEGEDDGVCEMCGRKEELRPYGPNGENVCFECAMKDEQAARRKFRERVDGPPEVKRQ